MIVCICNNIRDRDVATAMSAGAASAAQVFAAHAATPRCGRCMDFIDEMIGGVDDRSDTRPCGRMAAACPC